MASTSIAPALLNESWPRQMLDNGSWASNSRTIRVAVPAAISSWAWPMPMSMVPASPITMSNPAAAAEPSEAPVRDRPETENWKLVMATWFSISISMVVAVAGPNLETRAEYRFLRGIGADVVGMSTVPEVLVAVHSGLRVVGFSIITDLCLPDALEPVDIDKIIATRDRGNAGPTAPAEGLTMMCVHYDDMQITP